METLLEKLNIFIATVIAILVGIFVYLISFLSDSLLFEDILGLLLSFEDSIVKELIIFAGIVVFGLAIDLIRQKRRKQNELEVQEQRVKVLKATMTTVHDIVNNSLSSLQLVKIEMQDTQDTLSPKSLELIDSIIKDTTKKLKILGDLESIPEKKLANGLSIIDYENGHSKDSEDKTHVNE